MATTYIFSPDMFSLGTLATVGAVDGDFFADGTGGSITAPAFKGRSGDNALFISDGNNGPRVVLKNGPQNTVIVHIAIHKPTLPVANDRIRVRFADASNVTLGYFMLDPTGIAHIQNAAGTSLAQTATPVFNAGEWTLFEMRILMSATVGEFELRNENNDVLLNATGLVLSASAIAQVQLVAGDGFNNDTFSVSDFWIKDTTGTKNNTFGARRIFARKMTGDNAGNGWALQARDKLGDGILHIISPDANAGLRIADAAGFEIGAGDFTVEGFFRWESLPGVGATRTLLAKWAEAANTRSWRLRHSEQSGSHKLAFENSTDGTAGTATIVHDVVFVPVLNHWHHIAVSRSGGTSRLFIDGVKVGPATADAANYFDGAAPATIGAQAIATFDTEKSFGGWIDEIRWTIGAARYTAEFAPPVAKFPRDLSDPSWNNTQLLVGFDGGVIADESQFGRIVAVEGTTAAETPNDGDFGFQSIDKKFRDDTFIEAAFLSAKGTVEFTTNPTNTQTVTVGKLPTGSQVYTFKTVLAAAFDVLIGADAETSLQNLKAAINQEAGEGTIYGTGTVAHPDAEAFDLAGVVIEIKARVPGTGGNAITLASTVTGVVLSGATLAGGVDIPVASEFNFEPIPSGVTAISAVTLATRRSLVGAGTANVQFGIRDAAGNLIQGLDHVPPANPAWQMDIMDSGAGGASWSAAALIGARTRNNRTT